MATLPRGSGSGSVSRQSDLALMPCSGLRHFPAGSHQISWLHAEEQLTHLTNLAAGTEAEAKHADMICTECPGGGSVFATGSRQPARV